MYLTDDVKLVELGSELPRSLVISLSISVIVGKEQLFESVNKKERKKTHMYFISFYCSRLRTRGFFSKGKPRPFSKSCQKINMAISKTLYSII